MKTFNSILTVVALGALLMFASCDELLPKKETGKEKNTKLLTNGSWDLASVTVNGVDKTSVYQGLTINFSSSGYTTTNGGAIWPASGTWEFTNDDGNTILRSDGVEINVPEIDESSLVLSMMWDKTTLGGGRGKSVEGQHSFSLTH